MSKINSFTTNLDSVTTGLLDFKVVPLYVIPLPFLMQNNVQFIRITNFVGPLIS
jgi:hypothetical protein